MAGSAGFSIQITAVDAATKQIDAINAKIKGMQAPAERLTKSFGKLADNTGITKLATGMRNLARESFSAFENIGRMAGPLGAITGAASIAGLAKMASTFGDFGNRTQIASSRAGLGAKQFLDLGNAARLAGSSSEAMGAGLTALKDNIFEINAGRGAPMTIAAFNTLGVKTKNLDGTLRSSVDVFADLSTEIAKVKDSTQRATLEMLTMGASGAALDPLMKLGADGVARLTEEGQRLYGVTNEQVAASVEFHKKTEAITIATEGLGIAIAADLLPVIGPVITQMTKWIEANKDWISADIKGFVEGAIPKIKDFATGADDVAKSLGGWKTVLEGVVGIALLGWITGILAALSPLTIALAAIVVTMEKINSFKDKSLAELPVGSPLWANVPQDEQTNYPNSPRSQAFLHPNGGNPNEFKWYNPGSWRGHGADQQPGSLPTTKGVPTADLTMDPTKRGFLETLAGPESKGAYDVKNGGSRFKDYSQFPEGVAPGGTSTAAGKYQFTSGTWRSVAKVTGAKDFSPENQDRGAWYLASTAYRAKTGGDLEADLKAGNKQAQIAAALGPIWPSLPGGSQSHQSQDTFNRSLAANTGAAEAANVVGGSGDGVADVMARLRTAQGPAANVQGGSGTAGGANATTTVKGSANVNIKLGGFPPGTRTTATTDGGLFNGAPRVETAMAGAGP